MSWMQSITLDRFDLGKSFWHCEGKWVHILRLRFFRHHTPHRSRDSMNVLFSNRELKDRDAEWLTNLRKRQTPRFCQRSQEGSTFPSQKPPE